MVKKIKPKKNKLFLDTVKLAISRLDYDLSKITEKEETSLDLDLAIVLFYAKNKLKEEK